MKLIRNCSRRSGALVFGHMADITGLKSGLRRKRSDRLASENSFNSGLAEVPASGPHQPDGTVDRVHDSAAGLVEQRFENSGTEVLGTGIDEIDEAGAAVEFGKKKSGVGLTLGAFNPLKARSDGAVFAAAFAQDAASVAAHTHGWLCLGSKKVERKLRENVKNKSGRDRWSVRRLFNGVKKRKSGGTWVCLKVERSGFPRKQGVWDIWFSSFLGKLKREITFCGGYETPTERGIYASTREGQTRPKSITAIREHVLGLFFTSHADESPQSGHNTREISQRIPYSPHSL